jgi:PD-(D/E)XK endonuclease
VADLKRKGDLAELAVAADLARQGHRVLFPYGEDCPYDLVIERAGRFERVQVKHTRRRGDVLEVRCRSQSLTNGRVRSTTRYTAHHIDWLAAYEPGSRQCFYIPASELGAGRNTLTLRLAAARNHQRAGVRMAANYVTLRAEEMEPAGIEPATS